MIKAGMTKKDGGRLVLLGITGGNVRRLKMGDPINVDLIPLGIPGEIIICYGDNMTALKKQLEPLIGPQTEILENSKIGKGSMVKDYAFVQKEH